MGFSETARVLIELSRIEIDLTDKHDHHTQLVLIELSRIEIGFKEVKNAPSMQY